MWFLCVVQVWGQLNEYILFLTELTGFYLSVGAKIQDLVSLKIIIKKKKIIIVGAAESNKEIQPFSCKHYVGLYSIF